MAKYRRYKRELTSVSNDSESRLQLHVQTHTKGSLYCCSQSDCSFTSSTKRLLQQHEIKLHKHLGKASHPSNENKCTPVAATSVTVDAEACSTEIETVPDDGAGSLDDSSCLTREQEKIHEAEFPDASNTDLIDTVQDSFESFKLIQENSREETAHSTATTDSDSCESFERFLAETSNPTSFLETASAMMSQELSPAMTLPRTKQGRQKRYTKPAKPGKPSPTRASLNRLCKSSLTVYADTEVESTQAAEETVKERVQQKKKGRPKKRAENLLRETTVEESLVPDNISAASYPSKLVATEKLGGLLKAEHSYCRKACKKVPTDKAIYKGSIPIPHEQKGDRLKGKKPATPKPTLQEFPSLLSTEAEKGSDAWVPPKTPATTQKPIGGAGMPEVQENGNLPEKHATDNSDPGKIASQIQGRPIGPNGLPEKFDFYQCGYCDYKHKVKDILLQHMLQHR